MASAPAHGDRATRPPGGEPAPVVYERFPGAAGAPLPAGYRRREPGKTALYGIERDHLETFLAEGQKADPGGVGYPAFVEREFRDYLDCGQLSPPVPTRRTRNPSRPVRPGAGRPGQS